MRPRTTLTVATPFPAMYLPAQLSSKYVVMAACLLAHNAFRETRGFPAMEGKDIMESGYGWAEFDRVQSQAHENVLFLFCEDAVRKH